MIRISRPSCCNSNENKIGFAALQLSAKSRLLFGDVAWTNCCVAWMIGAGLLFAASAAAADFNCTASVDAFVVACCESDLYANSVLEVSSLSFKLDDAATPAAPGAAGARAG